MNIINDLNELNQIIEELENDHCVIEAEDLNNVFVKKASNLEEETESE